MITVQADRLTDLIASIMERAGAEPERARVCADHLVEFSAGTRARPLDLAALAAIDGIRDVRPENGSVRMQVTELHRAVPALLEELGRQAIPLTELRTHSATLEDVFVTLTGRHLRDE